MAEPQAPWVSEPSPGRVRGLVLPLAGAAVLTVVALLVMDPWPGVDTWGWLVWGRETLHLDLDTTVGPAWKPGAVLPIAVLSVFGDAAPALWIILAGLVAFVGVAAAFAIGDRLAGPVAGVVATLGVVLLPGFLGLVSAGYSDPFVVTFPLLAVWLHLAGRRRWALTALFVAGLIRPEPWLLLVVYGVWLAARDRGARPLVAALWLATPLLWFGIDALASGDAFHASATAKAQDESPTAAEVVSRARSLFTPPTAVGAVLAAALAVGGVRAQRRAGRRSLDGPDGTVLVLLVGGIAMLVAVVVMAGAGFGGLARFMFPAGAAFAVVGGVGVACAVGWLAGRRFGPALAAGLLVLVVVALVPSARASRDGVREVERVTGRGHSLDDAIAAAGGTRLLRCGRVVAMSLEVAEVAYRLDVPISRLSILEVTRRLPRGALVIPAGEPSARALERRLRLKGPVAARRGPWRLVSVRCPAVAARLRAL